MHGFNNDYCCLPMLPRHTKMICARDGSKVTTWRTTKMAGEYYLHINGNRQCDIRLTYVGEVWWKELLANPEELDRKIRREGYDPADGPGFLEVLTKLLRGRALRFLNGEVPMYEHDIEVLEVYREFKQPRVQAETVAAYPLLEKDQTPEAL